MAIVPNYYDQVVYITSPTTSVTVQELLNALRAAEDTPEGLAFGGPVATIVDGFVDASGKTTLGPGKATGITMTLHDAWYIEFWDGVLLGLVSDGNVAGGLDSRPVRCALGSADTVLQLGAVDTTIVAGNGGGDGGLTTEEHDQLMALDTSGITQLQTGISAIQMLIEDVLGVVGDNVKWSSLVFDSNHNLTSATITQYTDSSLSIARKAWDVTATYNGESEMQTYQLVRSGIERVSQPLTLGASDTIPVTHEIMRVQSDGGAVTVTSTPSIDTSDLIDGQSVTLHGVSDTNYLILQDDSVLPGSQLHLLHKQSFALGKNDILELMYYAPDDILVEFRRADNY